MDHVRNEVLHREIMQHHQDIVAEVFKLDSTGWEVKMKKERSE